MSLESLLERRDVPSEVQEVIKKELSELKGTKARLEYLLKSGPAIIYACEPWGDYQTKFMSENVKDILGYNSEDFLYNPSFWVERLHPEDKQQASESFSKILETHFFSEIYRFQQKDGTYRWMLEEANLIHDENGQPFEIVGYWTDITPQKEAEEQLRRERENLYRILNSTDDIIYIINSQHEIEFINAATEKEFGPVDGKRCYEYFNDFLEACLWCTADKVANGETIHREKTLPRNQKTYDMIDTPFKNLEGEISRLAILRDITERKQTEEALRESEEKYRSFLENFQGIAFKGYEDFSAGFFLGNVEEITGYNEESFTSGEIVFNQLIHPEDIQWINNDVEEFMSSSQKVTQREYRIIDKNGNLHWIQESIQKFYDEKLKRGGVYGTLVDITERKQAEEALQENQELFTQFMDHLPAAAFIKDKDSVTLFANKFLKDAFGGETWIGKTAMELFPEEAARKMIIDDQKALTEGLQIITEELRDINNVANTYRTYKFPIKRKNKENLLGGIGIDVTLLQKTEDLLRKERENFYNILNTINDLIYIVNVGFEIEFVNAALEGEYDKGAVGNKCYEYFNGFDEPCSWCTMKEVLEGETVRWEKTRERNQRTYDIIDTPLRNSDGSISLLSILRNITERKQTEEALRESELKFRTFIETLPQPVWIYQDYQCRYANPAAEKVTGFSMEELSSMHFWDFLHPDYKEIAIKGGKALEQGVSPPVSEAIVKFITKSGNEKWLDTRLELIDFEGKRATLITAMDITRRKEAEEALRESETKYRTLVERANDGIAIVEGGKLGDQFKFVNQRFAQMLGYKPEELLNMSYAQAVHPDVFPKINERRKARLAGKEVPLTYDSKLIRKDGSPLEVGLNLGVIDYQGEDAVIAIVRDITERKKVEQALKENEEKYRSFIENFQGIAFKGYADYSQEFFLGKVEEITGYLENDFLSGKITFKDLIYLEDSERIAHDVLEFYSSSKESHRREYRIKDRYGAIHWLQEDIKKFTNKENNTVGVYGTIQDITKRKQVEEALRKSEEKYRLLFELAPIGIGISNPEGRIVEANQKILEIMGYTLDEAKTINLTNTYVNPEDREKLIKRLQIERQIQDYELELKRKDGTPYYSLLNISHMELGDQEVYLTTQRDLTEWKEMDRAKRETEERLRKFMESATDGFTLLDSNLNFIDINKAGLTGLGLSREEVIGKNFLEIFPKLRDSDTYKKYHEVLKTGNPYYLDDIDSAPLIRQKYYSVRAFKVGNGLGILTTDISNRVKAEKTKEELEQRRDSFVWMTSHELRTPLTVLTGYCDFLMEHINDLAQQRITNILGVMKSNLDRLERLTSKVSTIGQIERGIFEIEKTSINFCDFLQDTLEPYHQLLGNQFESRGCLEETSIIIDGDPHRLQQVIDNIIGNAIKQTNKDHRKIKIQTKISPSKIKIEVIDNGAGIETENLNVIFDQFVSIPTEFSATGTGIGLYLCQKTLEAHGGRITAKSKGLGRGATFIIELPRTNSIVS